MLFHLTLYSGVQWLNYAGTGILFSFFIPVGAVLYLYCIGTLKGPARRGFLAITLAAVMPTLVLGGSSYYPRFEWVNLACAFLAFVLIDTKKDDIQTHNKGASRLDAFAGGAGG